MTKKIQTAKRTVPLFLFAMLSTALFNHSCIEKIETSKGLLCENDTDCWDNLPCIGGVCGKTKENNAEPPQDSGTTPDEPASKPEEPTSEGKTEGKSEALPENRPETLPENSFQEKARACKGDKLGFGGTCKTDSDCCPGQKCKEYQIPKFGTLKFCSPCKINSQCPEKTICCQSMGICAARCSKP